MSKDGVYVCADIGVNWLGKFDRLIKSIRECAAAGVDAVKLQYFTDYYLTSSKTISQGLSDKLRKMVLDMSHINAAKCVTEELGIEMVVTPFGKLEVEQLAGYPDHHDGIKVRAADWLNKDIWNAIKDVNTKRYISFPHENGQIPAQGATPEEVLWALSRRGPDDFKVYCVPKYPPMLKELHLTNVAQYDGFSSHYPDYRIPLMAATLAVNWQKKYGKRRFYLEVHFKPSRINNQLLPDARVSLDRHGLKALCDGVKMLEEAIG